MNIIDISLGIHKYMLFYPGDPEFEITRVYDLSQGDEIALSSVNMGVHTGTHIDSPAHFLKEGSTISDLDLTKCYGICQVIDLTHIQFGEKITKEELLNVELESGLIVLLKTRNSTIINEKFRDDYIALNEEAAEFLLSTGIQTIGIDYLSIGGPETHRILLSGGIVVYEALDLARVAQGKYTFIGFPLKIVGSEGAPARVVLLTD